MIRLITGVPGSGKTLRAMHYVIEHKERAEKEGKPFRCVGNVDGVKPELMGEMTGEWYEEPENTLVVLDECQTMFRPASPQAQSPKRITELEVHRHKGIDLILVTQHPKLMNHHVRRLVGHHEHITRKNNFGLVNVHAMSRSFDPDDRFEIGDADLTPWKHPKKLFETYKSAEVHTEVKGIPRAIKIGGGIIGGGALALVAVLSIFSSSWAQQFDDPQTDSEPVAVDTTSEPAPEPQTDKITATGGIWTDDRCRVYDESGHVINTTWAECKNAVERGFPTPVEPRQT